MVETTGERLRRLRGNRKIAEVARDVGLSSAAISMYENGQRTPSDKNKKALAAYYGRSVAYIFFNTAAREM